MKDIIENNLESKKCTKCLKVKLLTDFRKKSANKSGYAAECKVCNVTRFNDWKDNLPEDKLEAKRAYARLYAKTYVYKDISKRRKGWKLSKLKSKYNLTEADVVQMVSDHNNKCAICKKIFGTDMTDKMTRYNIDHCHKTKKVRGLLCTRCNLALGNLEDDINILQSMIKYLSAA